MRAFEWIRRTLKEAFSPRQLVANLVFLAISVAVPAAWGAFLNLPIGYQIAFGASLFLLLVAAGVAWRRREGPADSTTVLPSGGWGPTPQSPQHRVFQPPTDPEGLDRYLSQIADIMEKHGYGRKPPPGTEQEQSKEMNARIRAEAQAVRQERSQSLMQLRTTARELSDYLRKFSDRAAKWRSDTSDKALGFGVTKRVLNQFEVEEEREILNAYHSKAGSFVIATYEALRKRGHKDEELDRIYKDPNNASEIREISLRFEALVREIPEWACFHLEWSEVFGGPGVWLDLGGPDSDPRTNVWCRVTGPDGRQVERDQTDAFSSGPRSATPVSIRWLYPQHFPDPPKDPKELPDGKYEVKWYGQQGVGRELLVEDAFLIDSGRVTDLDGTPARQDPDFGD